MRLTEHVTLIDPDGGATVDTVCHPMLVRGSETQEAGVRVSQGSLQIVVDSQGVDEQWQVEYRERRYGVIAVTPYLKRRYPPRDVLLCERISDV